MTELPRWFALTVKHHHEQIVDGMLRFKNFETVMPTFKMRQQWSDRNKLLELPLFPGYVFCRFAGAGKLEVLNTPGVGRVVGFGGQAAPIPDDEMEAIQAAIQSRLPLRPWLRLQPGDRVRVDRGPLRGVEGTFVREKDECTFVIGIEMLQRWLAVDMDPDSVVPLRHRVAHA